MTIPSDQPVTVSLRSESSAPCQSFRRTFPDVIGTKALYDRRQGKVVVAGVMCENSHELLKRSDSTPASQEVKSCILNEL